MARWSNFGESFLLRYIENFLIFPEKNEWPMVCPGAPAGGGGGKAPPPRSRNRKKMVVEKWCFFQS